MNNTSSKKPCEYKITTPTELTRKTFEKTDNDIDIVWFENIDELWKELNETRKD